MSFAPSFIYITEQMKGNDFDKYVSSDVYN